MFDHILAITNFMIAAFLHIWPYLLITIPLAVAVQMSGASKYINRAFAVRPVTAIFLATVVGAFSPFCSCGVIPVVASLLIGGVPLAPVMAFWIASPSMDPEIFFLSVGTIGWQLAVWRLGATLVLSLSAGFVTHYVVQRGWLGQSILRTHKAVSVQSNWQLLKQGWYNFKQYLTPATNLGIVAARTSLSSSSASSGATATITLVGEWQPAVAVLTSNPIAVDTPLATTSCGDGCGSTAEATNVSACDSSKTATEGQSCGIQGPVSFWQRLVKETWVATALVAKFMTLAFFLEALIILYVPSEWIVGVLGPQNPLAIVTAALIGVPVYTSNLSALPMISGLLAQGMNPAAALTFLIAGPTTTLPAMAAVWGLVSRRVFALYVSYALVGAVVLGYVYSLVSVLGF